MTGMNSTKSSREPSRNLRRRHNNIVLPMATLQNTVKGIPLVINHTRKSRFLKSCLIDCATLHHPQHEEHMYMVSLTFMRNA